MTQITDVCQTQVSSPRISVPKGEQLCGYHSIKLMHCFGSFWSEKLEASPTENSFAHNKKRSFCFSSLYQNEEPP